MTLSCSVKTHVGSFSSVPAGHLGSALEFEKLTGAGLEDGAFFLTLVEELLLATSEGHTVGGGILLVVISPNHVLGTSVKTFVGLTVQKTGPKSGPSGHK